MLNREKTGDSRENPVIERKVRYNENIDREILNMKTPNIVIYSAPDGSIELKAKLKDDTLWLTLEEIARLFEVQRPAITKHIKNIFATKELQENSVCSILELTARDGKKYKTKLYNLDLILSVGYRVNSKSATQFCIWATNVLKQYLTQGYALNKQVLL